MALPASSSVDPAPAADPGAVSQPRSVSSVVQTLAAEMAELAQLGERMQFLAVRLAPVPDEALVVELQAIDLMVQRLSALAAFSRALAPGLVAAGEVDVAAAAGLVTLERTRRRLEGRATHDGVTGEVEFF